MNRLGSHIRVPLTIAVLGALFHWLQGRGFESPWLLPDELRAADGARSLVAGGRDGTTTLFSFLTAPLWLAEAPTAYELVKALGAIAVGAAAFPAYALARLVAEPAWAAAAAVVSVVAPATVYASAVGPVGVAYPFAAAGSLFVVRFLLAGRRRDAGAAIAALGIAAASWPWLIWFVLPALGVIAATAVGWRGLARWPAASLLVVTPVTAYAAVYLARGVSPDFRAGTADLSGAASAAAATLGAFALGIGLVPLTGLLAGSSERPARVLRLVLGLALVLLAFGAGVRAAGVGDVRGADEALMLAAVPLSAAAGAALARTGWRHLVLALAAVGFVVALVPLGDGPPERSPGLALARSLDLSPSAFLVALLVAATVLIAALFVGVGGPRARAAAGPAIAFLVLVAAGAGEVRAAAAAASGARVAAPDLSDFGRVGILASNESDARWRGRVLFWNPLASVVSPPLERRSVEPRTGRITPPLPRLDAFFDSRGRRLVGDVLATSPAGTVVRAGRPARVLETTEGLFADGWSSDTAIYRRFQTDPGARLAVDLSREAWNGPDVPGRVEVGIGEIGGPLRVVRRLRLGPGESADFEVAAPPRPFRVVVRSETFSPADFGQPDMRQLGVQVRVEYRGEV